MLVGGEVGWYPVNYHAQIGLMAGIDEGHEIFRRAKTTGGREEAGHLIAPGAVKGMLGHRQ